MRKGACFSRGLFSRKNGWGWDEDGEAGFLRAHARRVCCVCVAGFLRLSFSRLRGGPGLVRVTACARDERPLGGGGVGVFISLERERERVGVRDGEKGERRFPGVFLLSFRAWRACAVGLPALRRVVCVCKQARKKREGRTHATADWKRGWGRVGFSAATLLFVGGSLRPHSRPCRAALFTLHTSPASAQSHARPRPGQPGRVPAGLLVEPVRERESKRIGGERASK